MDIGEDVVFNKAYYTNCLHCIFIPSKLYYYWQNDSSATHRYRSNTFSLHLPTFKARLPLIEEKDLSELCSIFFYRFSNMLDNIFDQQNTRMSFVEKMQYNQRMICTEEFQYCLAHAALTYENPILIKMLKSKNYYAYWLLEKAAGIKRRIGGVFK